VWPFPTFCFTYYYFDKDIMGSGAAKPAVSKKDTEVLTMHPSFEKHANEETNSGFIFSLCIGQNYLCLLLSGLCPPLLSRVSTLLPPWKEKQRNSTGTATAAPMRDMLVLSLFDLFASSLGQGGNGG
jgi:hypothetical protein